MSALESLLARVRAATGPDRKLDADICTALLDPKQEKNYWGWQSSRPQGTDKRPEADYWIGRAPLLTASIDAAIALVERCLPDKTVRVQPRLLLGGKYQHCTLEVDDDDSGDEFEAENLPTGPLAILDVLLQALISKEAPKP